MLLEATMKWLYYRHTASFCRKFKFQFQWYLSNSHHLQVFLFTSVEIEQNLITRVICVHIQTLMNHWLMFLATVTNKR